MSYLILFIKYIFKLLHFNLEIKQLHFSSEQYKICLDLFLITAIDKSTREDRTYNIFLMTDVGRVVAKLFDERSYIFFLIILYNC